MQGFGFFSPYLGCCRITLPRQVSELWLLGNESWSQLTRLSMAGLKILTGIHRCISDVRNDFVMSLDKFSPYQGGALTIVSHGQTQKEQYSHPASVTSRLGSAKNEQETTERSVESFFYQIDVFSGSLPSSSQSVILQFMVSGVAPDCGSKWYYRLMF